MTRLGHLYCAREQRVFSFVITLNFNPTSQYVMSHDPFCTIANLLFLDYPSWLTQRKKEQKKNHTVENMIRFHI